MTFSIFSDEYYQGVRYSQKLCIKCSFPNLPIVEPPNLSFPNTYRVTKCKNSEIKMWIREKKKQKKTANQYRFKRKQEKNKNKK